MVLVVPVSRAAIASPRVFSNTCLERRAEGGAVTNNRPARRRRALRIRGSASLNRSLILATRPPPRPAARLSCCGAFVVRRPPPEAQRGARDPLLVRDRGDRGDGRGRVGGLLLVRGGLRHSHTVPTEALETRGELRVAFAAR